MLKLRSFIALGLLLGYQSSSASLISADDAYHGIGSITKDTSTGLEWLDLPFSTNKTGIWMALNFTVGNNNNLPFHNFRFASQPEVTNLFVSANIPNIGTDGTKQNVKPSTKLIELVGATSFDDSKPQSFGFVAGTGLSTWPVMGLDYYLSNGTPVYSAVTSGWEMSINIPHATVGYWLVRSSESLFSATRPVSIPVGGISGSNSVSFDGHQFIIQTNISFVGGSPKDDIINLWESGIEKIWSKQFNLIDGGIEYPIIVDVDFVDSVANANYILNYTEGLCRPNALNWCSEPITHYDNRSESALYGQVYAHEFGHLLGLYDEYVQEDSNGQVNASVDPKANPDDLCVTVEIAGIPAFTTGAYCNSLMADYGPVQERYFDGILDFINNASGSNYVLGNGPLLNSYQFIDPGQDFFVPIESPMNTSIPEPSTISLLLLGWFGLYALTLGSSGARKCRLTS